MTVFQSIIFSKDYFTKRTVDQWLKRHNFKRIKPLHETVNYFRARLRVPDEDLYDYRMKTIRTGIKAVIQFPKYE